MKKTRHKFVNIFCAILISTFVAGLLLPTLAAEATDEQLLVDKARITFESFMADIFSFSRSKGAFAGLALDGAVLALPRGINGTRRIMASRHRRWTSL